MKKSQYLIYGTTGFEAFVHENNNKYSIPCSSGKTISKETPTCDSYKLVYTLFPDSAEKAANAKHQFINGFFCYVYKATILIVGLEIVGHISFFDDDFRNKHPEINTSKSDTLIKKSVIPPH
ncbi:hypothetical protein SAMN02910436_02343 [Ruminococcaceae bacterium P7]|nr:hypothetical protein SAMN02910436_02343 [Ruminococcaceae bacterium P7]